MSATAAAGGQAVPLEGDQNITVAWDLDKGAVPADPVVDVARRTLVLMQLGHLSASWTDRATITSAVSALTEGDVVSDSLVADWTDTAKDPARGQLRVLIAAPTVDGAKASVLACINTVGVPAIKADRATTGIMTRIDLAAAEGIWRVSSYDQNTAPTPREFFQRCKTYGAP